MASCYYMYFFELKKIYHEKYLIVFPNAAILSYNWVDFYVFTLFFLRKKELCNPNCVSIYIKNMRKWKYIAETKFYKLRIWCFYSNFLNFLINAI